MSHHGPCQNDPTSGSGAAPREVPSHTFRHLDNTLGRIDVAHVVISGFLQHAGRANGLQDVWTDLRGRHHNGRVLVDLREWDTCWSHYAELLWRMRPADDSDLKVYLYAYSYGAGWGAIRLGQELRKRGLAVAAAVLADPVYRHPLWVASWRSLWPFSTVWVPPNVRQVYWLRQRYDWPRGHQVLAVDSTVTAIDPPVLCERSHLYMDESPEFRRLARLVAESSRGGPLPWVDHEGQIHDRPAIAEDAA